MKTIGVLGGMSCESTTLYYNHINTLVKQRLGGLHSAEIVLLSVDFAPVEQMQAEGNWDAAGRLLADRARRAEMAGADLLILATNTMHLVAPAIEAAISIPFLHIADATAKRILADKPPAGEQPAGSASRSPAAEEAEGDGTPRVGLLGTRFTMERDFYAGRLRDRFGIKVITPPAGDRDIVHRIIFDELVLGKVRESSRAEFVRIADELAAAGAAGVILGCTEIGLLLGAQDVQVPLFDTTYLHAEAAVDAALA